MNAPARCTACNTAIPAGSLRCPGCGRIYGDANKCPSCQAYAGVRQSGDDFVCAACGAPRAVGPGTYVMRPSGFSLAPTPSTKVWAKSVAASGGSFALQLAGAGVVATSWVAAGLVAVLAGSSLALVPAGVIALAGLGVGGLLVAWGSRASRHAASMSSSADELEVLALAEKMGGSLYATDLARAVGIGVAEAEARLTAMADGTRVTAEVSPEGLLRFEFREIRMRRQGALPTRIAMPEPAAQTELVEIGATTDVGREREK